MNSSVYKGGTVGASVTYLRDGFFVDGLAKADILNLQLNTLLGGLNGATSGPSVGLNTVGGIGELGYRFGFGSAFFEPIGTLIYSQTHIDGINALSQWGTNIDFGTNKRRHTREKRPTGVSGRDNRDRATALHAPASPSRSYPPSRSFA